LAGQKDFPMRGGFEINAKGSKIKLGRRTFTSLAETKQAACKVMPCGSNSFPGVSKSFTRNLKSFTSVLSSFTSVWIGKDCRNRWQPTRQGAPEKQQEMFHPFQPGSPVHSKSTSGKKL
jgi:hypothetical protein